MSKPRLICMCGLPRSGKSTIARKLADANGWPVVSGDAIRLALHGQRFALAAEPMVRALKILMIRALFIAGQRTIISDDTHYSREARDAAKSADWDTVFYPVDTPVEVCVARAYDTSQEDLEPVIRSMDARKDPLDSDEQVYP
jgi:predicted kinase